MWTSRRWRPEFCFTGLAGNNPKNLAAGVNNHLSQPQKNLNIEQSLSTLARMRSTWMPRTHLGRHVFKSFPGRVENYWSRFDWGQESPQRARQIKREGGEQKPGLPNKSPMPRAGHFGACQTSHRACALFFRALLRFGADESPAGFVKAGSTPSVSNSASLEWARGFEI